MKFYKIFLLIALCLLTPSYGNCEEENSRKDTILSTILKKEKILAINYWNFIDGEILCVVTSHNKKVENESLTDRKLIFYKKIDDKLTKMFEYETVDNFIGMYPLRDANGDMVTIWVGGSAYHFNIFSLVANKIKMVLEEGSKQLPEIVDIDNDGENEILVAKGGFLIDDKTKKVLSYPETVNIYKKENESYKLINTTTWDKRLEDLKIKKLR